MSPMPRTRPSPTAATPPVAPGGEALTGPLTVPDDAGAGWLRAAMDRAATAAATRLAAGPVLAVAASKAAVGQAVGPGDTVQLHATDLRYGTTSLTLTVAAWVGDAAAGAPEKAAEAAYTFIAVDAGGLPRPVLEPSAKACDDPASADSGDETWTPPT